MTSYAAKLKDGSRGEKPPGRQSEHALELLLEARETAAAVHELLVAAGPGRVSLGVDVEGERVALLAVGRVGLELGAVRHHHLDEVVVGMKIFGLLHGET